VDEMDPYQGTDPIEILCARSSKAAGYGVLCAGCWLLDAGGCMPDAKCETPC